MDRTMAPDSSFDPRPIAVDARKGSSLSAFSDKERPPTSDDVASALGSSASRAWIDLVTAVTQDYAGTSELWHFASAKFGWSLRLRGKDRILLYLIPQQGSFLVGIVLGDRAVAAATASDLPRATLDAIAAAPRYAEGTGLRLPVTEASRVPDILRLLALKVGVR